VRGIALPIETSHIAEGTRYLCHLWAHGASIFASLVFVSILDSDGCSLATPSTR